VSRSDPLLTMQKLVSDVVSGQGYNVNRLCQAFHLKAADFAELTGRDISSVARSVRDDGFVELKDPATVRRVRELVELLGLLRAMGLDAGTWLKTPLPSYDGRTAFEVFRDGTARELISRLLGLAMGDVGA
jgi:hypothetical protein